MRQKKLYKKFIQKSSDALEREKGVKLRRKRTAEIEEEEEKNINNELFKEYFSNYQIPSDMYKKLREEKVERNEYF